MSVVNRHDVKLELPRSGCDPFWQRLLEDAAGDRLRLKYLAMLGLRENSGWPLAEIAAVFRHPKGHVSRVLKTLRGDLRRRYADEFAPSLAGCQESPD